jgi:hypothetical protein
MEQVMQDLLVLNLKPPELKNRVWAGEAALALEKEVIL